MHVSLKSKKYILLKYLPCLISPFSTTPWILYHRNGVVQASFDLIWSSLSSSNTMTGFMSNTAVEVVNSRYRCLNRPSVPGSSRNDQNTGRLSRASALPPACWLSYFEAFSWLLTCLIFVCSSATCLNALLTTTHVWGYVRTISDSETEHRRKCTGYGFCSHQERCFQSIFCSGTMLLYSNVESGTFRIR